MTDEKQKNWEAAKELRHKLAESHRKAIREHKMAMLQLDYMSYVFGNRAKPMTTSEVLTRMREIYDD